MNTIKPLWWKWVLLTTIAALLFWGGLAIRLKVIGRNYLLGIGILLMTMGLIIFGTLLVVFVVKYLKYSKPSPTNQSQAITPTEHQKSTNNKNE